MKTKVKFYALLLAVALFFAGLFGLGGVLRANAEGLPAGSENEPSLYYITDRAESKEYFNSIGDAAPIPEEQKHFIYIQPQDFWNVMRQMYQSEYFFGIENAFFVLEVRSGFPQDVLTPQNEDEECFSDQIFIMLYEIFDFLRFNGCKSMFICGTDESRFDCDGKGLPYRRNAFLDFVDIHVNDDLRTMYHYTAIKRMEGILGDSWENTTILLDVSLGDSWDFFKTLIKYFVCTYGFQKNFSPFSPENVLDVMGVKVFFSRNGNDHVDPYAPTYKPENYFENLWTDAEYAFVIARRNSDLYEAYENLVDDRTNNVDGTYLYPLDYAWGLVDAYLPEIMQDFSLGTVEDLKRWDWYRGQKRCEITFKPIEYSEDGWLYAPVNVPWLDLLVDLTDSEILLNDEDKEKFKEFLNSSAPAYAMW